MDLNVFMNHSAPAVDALPIWATLDSFFKAFDRREIGTIRIYSHSQPFFLDNREIIKRLGDVLGDFEFRRTRGLADGYVRSVADSSAAFLFQVEHDWSFVREGISHNLRQIEAGMRAQHAVHLRFNAHPNVVLPNYGLVFIDGSDPPMCRTDGFSNNPHILDREAAARLYVPFIDTRAMLSYGIEDILTDRYHEGWVYGGLGHPPTIAHRDGALAYKEVHGMARNRLRALRYANDVLTRWGMVRYGRLH